MKPWEKYKAPSGGPAPWAKYGPTFDSVIEGVLKSEGGYVNDPDDRGGETKYGISKRANPDVDVASLTVPKAMQIYKERYWDAIGADNLPGPIRELAFDAAVNQGVGWTKQALRRVGNDAEKFFALRARRYANIIRNDPTQAKFQRGWEKRLERLAPSGPWTKYRGE